MKQHIMRQKWRIILVLVLTLIGTVTTATAANAAPQNCAATVLRPGSNGPCVLELQQRLTTAGYPVSPQSGRFGNITRGAVKAFQASHGIPQTGNAGPLTWAALLGAAPQAGQTLHPLCYGMGVVLCADQSDRTLYVMRDGQLLRAIPVRFGGTAWDINQAKWVQKSTPNGVFRVGYKNVAAYSSTYKAAMPYFTGFIGAVYGFHYSPTFAAVGYGPNGNLGSHGCINIGTIEAAKFVFDNAARGTDVVITQ